MSERPHRTYDRIAAHFSATREHPWPEVESFVAEHADGGTGLDIGCGNGRHAEVLADRVDRVLGVDPSGNLLAEAGDRGARRGFEADLVRGVAEFLPLGADVADLALYVATLHHLRSRRTRRASLDELARALRPGARALVSAWSVEHERFDATEGFDTAVDWTLPDGERVPRFYHIYDLGEFEADIRASRLSLVESTVSSGNCYAVVAAR